MKKVLIVLGAIFAVLVVVAVVGFTVLAIKGSGLDKESKAYADAAVEAVIGKWDIKELEDRASSEFRSATTEPNLLKLFTMYRRLGKLKEYKGSSGQAFMGATTQNGVRTTAFYVANADFENASAQIKISLIKRNDRWEILGFGVNSNLFLDQR